MIGAMWSGRVLLKYWAIQAAGWVVVLAVVWVLADRFAWPRWIVWTIFGLWIAKDAALYPFLWRAYAAHGASPHAYPSAGVGGVALQPLNPTGTVRIGGEIWNASVAAGVRAIADGERVRVTDRDGMTLLVEPDTRN